MSERRANRRIRVLFVVFVALFAATLARSAWLQVVPSNLRILVHQLPERAQIDTQVTEQLIVELYSK